MAKRCPVKDTFVKIAPYWHIATGVLVAFISIVTFVQEVRGFPDRINRNEQRIDRIAPAVEEMRYNLKNLMNHMGVKYVEREQ